MMQKKRAKIKIKTKILFI